MSIITLADIAIFQADAEEIMFDTCTITRASTDPEVSTPTTVYSGKCRIRTRTRVRGVEAAGDAGTATAEERLEVHIPVSALDIELTDKVLITASINPTVTGDTYYVSGLFSQSAASAQRLTCERRIR